MKPMNFPERKRQRQILALRRMENKSGYYSGKNHPAFEKELSTLRLAVGVGSQRGKRTKVYRKRVIMEY